MKTYMEFMNEEITFADEKEIQKFGQRLFDKSKTYNVTFRVGTHSKDRFDDKRNEAPVTKASLISILKKGIPKIIKKMPEYIDKKICLSNTKTNLHFPMVVQETSDGDIQITTTSSQNKKDYWYLDEQIPIYVS